MLIAWKVHRHLSIPSEKCLVEPSYTILRTRTVFSIKDTTLEDGSTRPATRRADAHEPMAAILTSDNISRPRALLYITK